MGLPDRYRLVFESDEGDRIAEIDFDLGEMTLFKGNCFHYGNVAWLVAQEGANGIRVLKPWPQDRPLPRDVDRFRRDYGQSGEDVAAR
jgi:hypothetical protein